MIEQYILEIENINTVKTPIYKTLKVEDMHILRHFVRDWCFENQLSDVMRVAELHNCKIVVVGKGNQP